MAWGRSSNPFWLILVGLLFSQSCALPSFESLLNNLWHKKSYEPPTSTFEDHNSERVKRQANVAADSSSLHYEVHTTGLPLNETGDINFRYMPTLSNGNIGTTVYGNALYCNGLFNGAGANSHRARLPPIVMGRIIMDEQLEEMSRREYKFNAKEATFTEIIETPFANVIHRTYAHMKFTRLLVTQIEARHKSGTEFGAKLRLQYSEYAIPPAIMSTEDVTQTYHNRDTTNGANWLWQGETNEGEKQGDRESVYIYYKEPHSELVVMNPFEQRTFYMSVDHDKARAQADMHEADIIMRGTDPHNQLFKEHKEAWKEVWDRGSIEISEPLNVAKIVTFSQYYILSSLPNPRSHAFDHNEVYYGGARNSLAKGGLGQDYGGHIFWDSEMYILPAILMTHPEIAKYILRYRAAKFDEAQSHAESMDKEGIRFPWESAYTGADVTPDSCITCRDQQLFITAAVNHGIRLYYSATRDPDFINNQEFKPCDITRETARFLQSLATYNQETARYDIKNVMGPDDWHPGVNNNAFTNVITSLAIHWSRYFACLCNRNARSEVPDKWIEIALHLELPFDNRRRLHFQHENVEQDANFTSIKQVDTLLMAWPLHWNVSWDIVRNDLLYYEPLIDQSTPAMSWSFLTIGMKWTNEQQDMNTYFEKSYQDYVVQPFKIWTEYNEANSNDQQHSTVNFLPGMGGFLQSIVYGFAGLRIRPEILEFHNPTPPPQSNWLRIKGFKYIGVSMDIEISRSEVVISVLGAVNDLSNTPGLENYGTTTLLLRQNDSFGREERLTPGTTVRIQSPKNGFFIIPEDGTNCMHPWDHIYMPWGYSPWISKATSLNLSYYTFTIILMSSILYALSTFNR